MCAVFDISSQDLLMHIDSDISVYPDYIKDAERCFTNYNDCKLFLPLLTNDMSDMQKIVMHKFDPNLIKPCDEKYSHMPFCLRCCWRMLDNESL